METKNSERHKFCVQNDQVYKNCLTEILSFQFLLSICTHQVYLWCLFLRSLFWKVSIWTISNFFWSNTNTTVFVYLIGTLPANSFCFFHRDYFFNQNSVSHQKKFFTEGFPSQFAGGCQFSTMTVREISKSLI